MTELDAPFTVERATRVDADDALGVSRGLLVVLTEQPPLLWAAAARRGRLVVAAPGSTGCAGQQGGRDGAERREGCCVGGDTRRLGCGQQPDGAGVVVRWGLSTVVHWVTSLV
jgi:hypothetical protein